MKRILASTLLLSLSTIQVLAIGELGYGIKLNKEDNYIIVKEVTPNSIAEKSGIKAGEKLIKLNGKKADKIKETDIEKLNSLYKSLKLVNDSNKQYSLQPEDVTLLEMYNDINKTFNMATQYRVLSYKPEKVILEDKLDKKHVNYANAYFNYADAISIENAKLYVELFKVTGANVRKAKEVAKGSSASEELKNLYNLYSSIPGVFGTSALRHFLELAMYNEVNSDLIQRQISEFTSQEQKKFAMLAYNTKIVANLYKSANNEIIRLYYKNIINLETCNKWQNELKVENQAYNKAYEKLNKSLAANKIKYTKPGSMSNVQQAEFTNAPSVKWAENKEIVKLAKTKGYDSTTVRQAMAEERINAKIKKEEPGKTLSDYKKQYKEHLRIMDLSHPYLTGLSQSNKNIKTMYIDNPSITEAKRFISDKNTLTVTKALSLYWIIGSSLVFVKKEYGFASTVGFADNLAAIIKYIKILKSLPDDSYVFDLREKKKSELVTLVTDNKTIKGVDEYISGDRELGLKLMNKSIDESPASASEKSLMKEGISYADYVAIHGYDSVANQKLNKIYQNAINAEKQAAAQAKIKQQAARKAQRTQLYPKPFYNAANACAGQIKIGYPSGAPLECFQNQLRQQSLIYQTGYNAGYIKATLPYVFAQFYNQAGQFMFNMPGMAEEFYRDLYERRIPTNMFFGGLTNPTITKELYNKYMYGE